MKRLLLFMAGIIFSIGAKAQFIETTPYRTDDHYFSVTWDVNAPLANKDYVGKMSGKGIQIGYRSKINDHFYAGVQLSNATYNDYAPRQTYFSESGAVTTDIFKYVYSYGVTLNGDYYFTPEKRFSPFVGLGVGANYNSYKSFYNIYTNTDSGWGVLLRPEAGALLRLGEKHSWGLIGALHFDYASTKSDKFAYTNFVSAGFRVGIIFPN